MINDHLKLSPQGLKLLQQIEGLRLKPYDDQTGEQISEWCWGATIGYGHLIHPATYWSRFKSGISKADAAALLGKDLKPMENAVRHAIIVPLEQHQFDALVLLAFNIGASKFRTASAVRMINDARAVTDYPTLEEAWKAWHKSQGQENAGLIKRRATEWRLYSEACYV